MSFGLDRAVNIVNNEALVIGGSRNGRGCDGEETASLTTTGCHGAEFKRLAGGVGLASSAAVSDAGSPLYSSKEERTRCLGTGSREAELEKFIAIGREALV